METARSTAACRQTLTVSTPDGGSLALTVTEIRLTPLDDDLADCQLTATLDGVTYADEVEPAGVFYLWPAAQRTDPPALDRDAPVEIDLRLSLDFASLVGGQSAEAIAAWLQQIEDEDRLDVLRQSESWFALVVKQERPVPESVATGTLKVGFRTIWAGEPTGGIFLEAARYFADRDWTFSRRGEDTALEAVYAGDAGDWLLTVEAQDDAHQCIIYSDVPDEAVPGQLPDAAEYLHRANLGLPVGNFELDYDAGRVRFKTSLNVTDAAMNAALMENLVELNTQIVECYLPGLRQVLAGKAPLAAIEEAEADLF